MALVLDTTLEFSKMFNFLWDRTQDNTWIVTTADNSSTFVAYITDDVVSDLTGTPYETSWSIITTEWGLFKKSPQYFMYECGSVDIPSVLTPEAASDLQRTYEQLLAGACLTRFRAIVNTSGVNSRINSMLSWLESNKFYTTPASSRYHEAFPSGLLVHSLKVYNSMLELWKLKWYSDIPLESIVLTSLTHDWCKIGMYHPYLKNVKNEETGKWEQVEAYKREITGIPMGHGEASLYYIMKFVSLKDDEALAIRWHMGHWHYCDGELDELQLSNERYPLVHMLQFADQVAITDYYK